MANSSHVVIPKKDLVPWYDNNKDHTAAFKLFHYPFNFRISKIHLLDPRFIAQFGYVTTGNAETDRVLAQEEIPICKTIAEMVDIHRQGIGFRLQDPKDGVRMYEIIFRHLADWRQEIETNINPVNPPLDDLKAIDNFAKDLYIVARGFVVPTRSYGALSEFINSASANRGFSKDPNYKDEEAKRLAAIHQSTHKEQSTHLVDIIKQRQRYFSNGY